MSGSRVVVPAGSRLVLHGAAGAVVLRVLRDVTLQDDWSIPVLASIRALGAGPGAADLPTAGGVLRCDAHLALEDGQLLLRPGQHSAGQLQLLQRREDVRGPISLPLRGAVLSGVPGLEPLEVSFEGITGTISAGGLSAALQPDGGPPTRPTALPSGSRLYLELELPEGPLIPAVLLVIEQSGNSLRGQFVDIAPADRERLVRLVFAEERRRRAGRVH